MGFYSRPTLVRDAKMRGIKVRPTCIVQSSWLCTVEADDVLRLGLNQLNGVSTRSLNHLLHERDQCPWRNLDDLLLRCPLPKDERRVLASSGALNALGHHRRSALWEVEAPKEEDLISFAQARLDQKASVSQLTAMTPAERLEADYLTQSLTTGPHPMAYIRRDVPQALRACDLLRLQHGQRVNIAGQVICRQRPGTASGIVFMTIEDETGIANIILFPKIYERFRSVARHSAAVVCTGKVERQGPVVHIKASRLRSLPLSAPGLDGLSRDFH
jgi:error-prone DNA polymerase